MVLGVGWQGEKDSHFSFCWDSSVPRYSLSLAVFPLLSAGDRFLHASTSSLWSSMTLSLRHSSCTFLIMSSPALVLCLHWGPSSSFLNLLSSNFFFLTFNNAERFKSRKIVLKPAVQCKCEEKSSVSGEYMRTPPTIMRMMRTSFWRRLNQFINSKV